MSTEKNRTYAQCLNCGHVHIVERKIPMGKAIIDSFCEKCEYGRALNCGYSEDDVAELKDYFLNERYYY